MKTLLFMTFLGSMILACGTPRTGALDESDKDKVVQEVEIQGTPEERLAQRLRRSAGVVVQQNGDKYSVAIRGGVNSFQSNATPLFVVDGNQVGYEYNAAAQIIGTRTIRSVRVLKDSETTLYGIRGSGGVIEIKTNKRVAGS